MNYFKDDLNIVFAERNQDQEMHDYFLASQYGYREDEWEEEDDWYIP